MRRIEPDKYYLGFLFQSTHPRRVRRLPRKMSGSYYLFQSTHPRRVRLLKEVKLFKGIPISIHAPAKGATFENSLTGTPLKFQSTHPRRVRPNMDRDWTLSGVISIHAPAKGATYVVACATPSGIFQSTHPRRVRPASSGVCFNKANYFNPRTREGCDTKGLFLGMYIG